ncbi:hypothetical protein E4U58_006191, partial [Claviceps cyperi]
HVRRGNQELEKWMAVSHNQTDKGYTLDTPLNELFTSNTSCIFVPETIIGPYYVAGEYLRRDISENEPGVPIYVDFQFVDVKTCEAVPHLIVDMWHASAMGVYSGVTAAGQGGLKTNFGRGVQIADDDGVVQYRSIFPGHYTDRTSHLHRNLDQSLIAIVEANPPYSSNKQPLTDNRHDEWTGDEATELSDPFMKYVYLGDDVKDGLLLCMTVGLDKNACHNANVSTAAHWHPWWWHGRVWGKGICVFARQLTRRRSKRLVTGAKRYRCAVASIYDANLVHNISSSSYEMVVKTGKRFHAQLVPNLDWTGLEELAGGGTRI